MYDLLVTSYEKKILDIIKELKFRATPAQISRWELAIEVLMYVDKDLVDNPMRLEK